MPSSLSLLLTALLFTSGHASAASGYCTGITVDGDPYDWEINSMTAIPMHEAGKASKELAANAYTKNCCAEDGQSSTICILVLATDKHKITESKGDTWYKDYDLGSSARPGTIKYVVKRGKTVGWEGCFPSPMCDTRNVQIHANYDGSNTASTGKNNNLYKLDLSCPAQEPVPEPDLELVPEPVLETVPESTQSPSQLEPLTQPEPLLDSDPCPPEDPTACVMDGKACTHREDDCCGDLECTGYNFFKTCKEAPECHPEWHDCSDLISCCGDLVCAKTGTGLLECHVQTMTTRSVDVTLGNLEEEEPEEQVEVPNLTKSVKLSDDIVGACVSGDPHVKTFDKLIYDCQGIGEFILMKSKKTRRQAQGRFKQVVDRPVSVMRGVVVQDEADSPKVQLQVAETDALAEPFGDAKCMLQFHIDGVQKSLFVGDANGNAFEDDALRVTTTSNAIKLFYKESELEVEITIRGGDRCALGACFYMPENDDELVGMLGSPDKDITNDWMDRGGVKINQAPSRRGPVPYGYCTDNWCMTDSAESIFKYHEVGNDFDTFEHCDFPEGSMAVEEIEALLTAEQTLKCGGNIMCMEETVGNGEDGAKHTMQDMEALDAKVSRKAELKEACTKDKNCKSGNCFKNGWAGERCVSNDFKISDLGQMTEEGGLCNDVTLPCDGGGETMACIMKKDTHEYGRCHKADFCGKRGSVCATDDDCCGSCLDAEMGLDGGMIKRCMMTAKNVNNEVCLATGERCSSPLSNHRVGPTCCNESCVQQSKNVFKCVDMPECLAKRNSNCNPADGMPTVCDGFVCMKLEKRGNFDKAQNKKSFKFVTKKKPTCAAGAGECGLPDGNGVLECCDLKRTCQLTKKGDKKMCKRSGHDAKNEGEAVIEAESESVNVDTVEEQAQEAATTITKTFKIYNKGNPNQAVVAKAHTTVDCTKKELCIRVEAEPDVFLRQKDSVTWLKDYDVDTSVQTCKGDVTYKTNDRGKATEWKACYDVSGRTNSTNAQIQVNWGSAEGRGFKNKASTGVARYGTIELDFCG